jgi:hypothetical protein
MKIKDLTIGPPCSMWDGDKKYLKSYGQTFLRKEDYLGDPAVDGMLYLHSRMWTGRCGIRTDKRVVNFCEYSKESFEF